MRDLLIISASFSEFFFLLNGILIEKNSIHTRLRSARQDRMMCFSVIQFTAYIDFQNKHNAHHRHLNWVIKFNLFICKCNPTCYDIHKYSDAQVYKRSD